MFCLGFPVRAYSVVEISGFGVRETEVVVPPVGGAGCEYTVGAGMGRDPLKSIIRHAQAVCEILVTVQSCVTGITGCCKRTWCVAKDTWGGELRRVPPSRVSICYTIRATGTL